MIGSMCKICVSLFAFLTGWVLYLNPKFKSYSYNLRKAKSFILNYWIAELIFIIVGFMFCLKLPSFSILLANLFGFETGAYEMTMLMLRLPGMYGSIYFCYFRFPFFFAV